MKGFEKAQAIAEALSERAQLVHFCARLTGDPQAAEDLAQETLLEAWRHNHKVYDPSGRVLWLKAIARNVCLRWARRRWQATAHITSVELDEVLADESDLELDVEAQELAELVGQALSHMPPATHQLLVDRYLHQLPLRTIAERLGMSEDAVSMRLSRGKQHLHQVLTTKLQVAIQPYLRKASSTHGWLPTRLWCLTCGNHRLLIRLHDGSDEVAFRCPGCSPDPTKADAVYSLTNNAFARLIGGLVRPKVVMGRTVAWAHTYFRQALLDQATQCTHCGCPVDIQIAIPQNLQHFKQRPHFLTVPCDRCGTVVSTSFRGLLVTLPEVQAFWQAHGRIQTLPDYSVEIAGQEAIVTRFESVANAASLEVLSLRDSLGLPTINQFIQRP